MNLIARLSLIACLFMGGCGFVTKKSTSPLFNSQHAGSCGPEALNEALSDLGIDSDKVEISNVILQRQHVPGIFGRFFISQEITSIDEMIDAAEFFDVQMIETKMDWRELRKRRFVVIILGVIRGTASWHYECIPEYGDIGDYIDVERTWWLRRR